MTTEPISRRSAAEQARVDRLLHEIFEEHLNFNRLLGFRVESLDPAAPRISFAMRKELIGHHYHGRLHGGVIATVLDTVGGLAAIIGLAEKYADESAEQLAHRFGRVGTIDLRTDFLHQGLGRKFIASAHLARLGGRIASTQMSLENDAGLLVATGAASYIVS